MTQEQSQDVLTSEVCRAVVLKLADLACSGQEQTLKAFGVTEQQIHQLGRLSHRDIWMFVDQRQSQVNVQEWIRSLLKEEVPEPYREYLLCGANNVMMYEFFKVSASQCSCWRDILTIKRAFRGRVIPHTKHVEVTKSLKAEPDFRRIEASALLKIAQKHQVSLCAIWNELKKWDKEYDEKKYKR